MADFEFLQNPISKQWVILAPRRAKRPDVGKGMEPVCPFCPGREGDEEELYRVRKTQNTQQVSKSDSQSIRHSDSSDSSDTSGAPSFPSILKTDQDWLVRVIPNKFPFAPIHELIIHSPEHHKNFGDFTQEHTQLILQTYKLRYNLHKEKGQVYIFHNRGEQAGESLPHAHTQLVVIPEEVKADIPRLDPTASATTSPSPVVLGTALHEHTLSSVTKQQSQTVETAHFYLFCPHTSQWPDEVWVAPKKRGRAFGEITEDELLDLSFVLQRIIQIMDLRHGHDFPFNFYIYPGGDWYVRIIPRLKRLGGFEIGTGIYVNTQDPSETIAFVKEHFQHPDEEKIMQEHQAEYHRSV